jgi:hypothetical protein
MGHITFHQRGDSPPLTFNLMSTNGLWFHHNPQDNTDYHSWSVRYCKGPPIIHRLNKAVEYCLGHLRYGCAGQHPLSLIHHDVDNQPKLHMHCFFKYLACMLATGDSRTTTNNEDSTPVAEFDDWFDANTDPATSENCEPGQHFHVDFGFMKGSDIARRMRRAAPSQVLMDFAATSLSSIGKLAMCGSSSPRLRSLL